MGEIPQLIFPLKRWLVQVCVLHPDGDSESTKTDMVLAPKDFREERQILNKFMFINWFINSSQW